MEWSWKMRSNLSMETILPALALEGADAAAVASN
jgi:hypothetical protein